MVKNVVGMKHWQSIAKQEIDENIKLTKKINRTKLELLEQIKFWSIEDKDNLAVSRFVVANTLQKILACLELEEDSQ